MMRLRGNKARNAPVTAAIAPLAPMIGVWLIMECANGRYRAADQIEAEETSFAQAIFHRRAKHPQEQHVERQVPHAERIVHEHAGDQLPGAEFSRIKVHPVCEPFDIELAGCIGRQSHQVDQQIDRNQAFRHDRLAMRRSICPDRNQHAAIVYENPALAENRSPRGIALGSVSKLHQFPRHDAMCNQGVVPSIDQPADQVLIEIALGQLQRQQICGRSAFQSSGIGPA